MCGARFYSPRSPQAPHLAVSKHQRRQTSGKHPKDCLGEHSEEFPGEHSEERPGEHSEERPEKCLGEKVK